MNGVNVRESSIRRFIERLLRYEVPGKISINELKRFLKLDKETILNIVDLFKKFLRVNEDYLVVDCSKVDIIEYCLRKGIYIDLERLSRYLSWQDFEELIKRFFREFNYNCVHRLRIPVEGRRLEIDLLAYRENVLLLIDSKRYVKAKVRRVLVEDHVRKVEIIAKRGIDALVSRLPTSSRYYELLLYPVIVTVHDCLQEIEHDVPIVSIYRLRDFLYHFYDNRHCYRCFVVYRF
ncbi:MAG: hypothetical protein GXO10_03360 [Crenarchaeota archaeon]|nr:hypothetical protein [Thermoproteota archaeon]